MRIAPVLAPYLCRPASAHHGEGAAGDAEAARGLLLLDGGLATALEARGHALSDALWSARLLRDAPRAIRAVHEDYFASGAQVATTASYQASFEGFARVGIGEDAATALLRRSVALADEARSSHLARGTRPANVADGSEEDADEAVGEGPIHPFAITGQASDPPLLVAASVGPYGAVLADGSEYRGDYGLDRRALMRFHRRRLTVLAEAGADLLACETIPSGEEVAALLALLEERGTQAPPAWLSVTCRDDARLRDGTPIEEAAARAHDCARVLAFGVNCVSPEHVLPLLERASRVTDLPLLAYPNRGERWDAAARAWEASLGVAGPRIAELARTWVAAGARLVGGCCRTGPAEIAALARMAAQLRGS